MATNVVKKPARTTSAQTRPQREQSSLALSYLKQTIDRDLAILNEALRGSRSKRSDPAGLKVAGSRGGKVKAA